MKATLSVRVDVDVEVEDEEELTQLRRSFETRAAAAVSTFWGRPRVLGSAVIRRANPGEIVADPHTAPVGRADDVVFVDAWPADHRQTDRDRLTRAAHVHLRTDGSCVRNYGGELCMPGRADQ